MNPKTTGFVNPCIRSAKSSASIARRQNEMASSRSENTDAVHPPSKPIKSISAVNSGTISSAASKRGATSLRLGSVPIARIASTCSVTSIDPSSDAIPVAHRPVTSNPVNAGPSSRTSAIATTSPVSEVCPNRMNCDPVCSTMTAPIKNPDNRMIGSDPAPIKSICSRVSWK